MCGSIPGYNEYNPPPGPKTLALATSYRLTLRSFMYFDHTETIAMGIKDLDQWIGEEQITVIEDIQTGLENAHKTLRRLFGAKESRQADTQEFVARPWRILVRREAK